jgi:hypothetical protein
MAKREVDWSIATPAQIDRSLRAWKIRLGITAANYVIVIAIAFWVGSAVVGLVAVIVGLAGMPFAWRRIRTQHAALRAKAESVTAH